MFQLLLVLCLFVQAGPNPNLATTAPQVTADARTGVNPATFEGIYREAKAVEAATVAGVNYAKYQALIQSFAKEAAILSDQPLSRDERAVLVLFKAALNAHMDSATIWRRKLASYDRNDTFQGGIFYSAEGQPDSTLEPLVKRYHIQIRSIRVLGTRGPVEIISVDSVQIPWIVAGKAVAEAVSLYMPSAPEQKKLDATDEEAIRTLERLAKPKP